MHAFKDAAGRDWIVSVNVATIRRVRAMMEGFDLQSLAEDGLKPLGILLADPVKLGTVLWCLCEEQAVAKNITEDSFYSQIFGESLDRAGEAFTQAFLSFGRKPMRVVGAKLIDKTKDLQTKLMAEAEKEIDNLDTTALVRKLIDSSGDSPESSGSTPAPTPSAS